MPWPPSSLVAGAFSRDIPKPSQRQTYERRTTDHHDGQPTYLTLHSHPSAAQLAAPLTQYTHIAGFALLTSGLGLLLCSAQTFKGHIDSKHERDRMQEMHEQKMHYLHEFHRKEIHARDARLGVLEEERKRYALSSFTREVAKVGTGDCWCWC